MALRKFYGAGDAKGFSKKVFFETVLAYVSGEDVGEDLLNLVAQAAEYELEGIELAKEKSNSKEKKPTLEKGIAKEISAALMPLLTTEPQTTDEIIEISKAKGILTAKGTPFSNPWVNTVFKALAEDGQISRVTKVVIIPKMKDGVTLNSEVSKVAYTR